MEKAAPAPQIFSLAEFRQHMPHVRDGMCWLNHASTSPFSQPVADALQRYADERMHGEVDPWKTDFRTQKAIRRHLGTLCGIPEPEKIGLVGNTSEGLNIVANGLSWQTGDRIALYRHEFPANVYPFLNLRKHGVELDWIDVPDARLTPDRIEAALTPKTRLLTVSSVQYGTGWKADLAQIGALCRQKGVIFVVDGIQSIGAAEMKAEEWGIDALASGGQKWQMGPQGSGFLYVSPTLGERLSNSHLGWLSPATPWHFDDYEKPLAPGARRFELGTAPAAVHRGYEASLALLNAVGIDAIQSRIAELTAHTVGRVREIGLEVYGPQEAEDRAGIVMVDLPKGTDDMALAEKMLHRKVAVAPRGGRIRIAPHAYCTEPEIDLCIEVLDSELRTA